MTDNERMQNLRERCGILIDAGQTSHKLIEISYRLGQAEKLMDETLPPEDRIALLLEDNLKMAEKLIEAEERKVP